MGLVLSPAHPAHTPLVQRGIACLGQPELAGARTLRVGVINLMPSAEAYEPMLLEPLGHGAHWVEPVWIRLRTHGYASSDAGHLARHYVSFAQAGALDGLVLTGAPVEELAYRDVRYFGELCALLERARHEIASTVGLCWGGMALAHLLGIDKRNFDQKLFGVYPLQGEMNGECAQSRHAGLADAQLESAAARGLLRVLASSARTGHTIVESVDSRFLIHLGHPEYTPARLRFEYLRDRELGRSDVAKPYAVEVDASSSPLPHGYAFFSRWLARLSHGSAQPDEASLQQSR